MKTNVIPVIIGVSGMSSKSFIKYKSNIPRTKSRKYRKAPHWAWHTYFRKYYHKSSFSIGTSIICTMNSNYRIAATMYSLGTWFVLGI